MSNCVDVITNSHKPHDGLTNLFLKETRGFPGYRLPKSLNWPSQTIILSQSSFAYRCDPCLIHILYMQTVKTRNFYGLLDLRELRLDHNDIRVIEDEGFAVSMVNTYSKLTWLYLHFNKLGAITEDNLYGLSYVKFLNLCHNELSYIEPGGLAMMRRLHTLVLNNNHLMDLTPGTFKQVRHLQHLNLAANQIRQLTLNTLQGLDRWDFICRWKYVST